MADIINAHIPYGGGKQRPTEIIVHCMGEHIQNEKNPEVYDHAVAFLNEYKLSAHALIAPNGDIYRCRFDEEQAWHARGHNKNTLGIEFLVEGEHDYGSFVDTIKRPYLTKLQMESGLLMVKDWLQLHDIKSIKRHSDISPGRKVDPGAGFPWDHFLGKL